MLRPLADPADTIDKVDREADDQYDDGGSAPESRHSVGSSKALNFAIVDGLTPMQIAALTVAIEASGDAQVGPLPCRDLRGS
jgi:hypothetical protein